MRILNDDRPRAVASNARVGEGGVLAFRTRLAQRYFEPVTATVSTVDGSAVAPEECPTSTMVLRRPAL